jgi:hypothetical protein
VTATSERVAARRILGIGITARRDGMTRARKARFLAATFAALVLLFGGVPSAGADGLVRVAEADGLTIEEAIERVEARFGGRVVRAETRERDGRRVHRLRLLSEDGRVRTVEVDAETGRIR